MNLNERIKFLSSKARFNLTTEEKEKFKTDFLEFKKMIKILDNFDLEKIEPMRELFELDRCILREDVFNDIYQSKDYYKFLLKNASKTRDNYIFLEKEKDDV